MRRQADGRAPGQARRRPAWRWSPIPPTGGRRAVRPRKPSPAVRRPPARTSPGLCLFGLPAALTTPHRPGISPLPRRGSGVLPGVRLGRGRRGPLARARGLPAEHARGRDVARGQRAGGVGGSWRGTGRARRCCSECTCVPGQVGAALDWPVGRRFFVRADARLALFRVGIGAGIGF